MKFQCGKCEKMYKIDFLHVCLNDLSFKCQQCDNRFSIKKDLTFSSSCKNSKIVCENCGNFIDENTKSCESCNLIINKPHEDLKIDNYFYELYEVNKKGKIYNKNTGKIIGSRKINMPAILACLVISILISVSVFYFLQKKNNVLNSQMSNLFKELLPGKAGRKDVQVVIMKSGRTYYVKKIEKDGPFLNLTNNNETRAVVLEKDVLQISKAAIE
jgi:hypothetical protein